MKRTGFLIGLYSAGAQVLLVRELVSSLKGDELFVGTALFGWLAAVAAGAVAGAKRRYSGAALNGVFAAACLALPLFIIGLRLSPLLVTGTPGETVSFVAACILSALAMGPSGMLSGWLFGAATHQDRSAAQAISMLYLWEGVGAFIGGTAIAVLIGRPFSTLTLSIIYAALLVALLFKQGRPRLIAALVAAIVCISAAQLVPRLDRFLDNRKHPRFAVVHSFDTRYTHQALLSRDNSFALLTDNSIEIAWPDRERVENEILVPLLYAPHARSIIYVGRTEHGVGQLASRLPDLSLTAVDPRTRLDRLLAEFATSDVRRVTADAVSFFARRHHENRADIVVLGLGEPGSYMHSRLCTAQFLRRCREALTSRGVLLLSSPYDSDRFLSAESTHALSVIYRTLAETFPRVAAWPGTSTLFLASDSADLAIPYDTIMARIDGLGIETQYIHDDYLFERLGPMKRERLISAIGGAEAGNSIAKPVLPHIHALHASRTRPFDRAILSAILARPVWLTALPALLVALFILLRLVPALRSRYPFFLFFTAGFVSLTLELAVFYLYQSTAGALYSHMSLLIGTYMLGLALGARYAAGNTPSLGTRAALTVLLALSGLLAVAFPAIGPEAALVFYLPFLFTAAAATSIIFVTATRHYYRARPDKSRGAGYGWEIAGSSCAALVTTTLLLPIVGLHWLLCSVAALIALALAGTLKS